MAIVRVSLCLFKKLVIFAFFISGWECTTIYGFIKKLTNIISKNVSVSLNIINLSITLDTFLSKCMIEKPRITFKEMSCFTVTNQVLEQIISQIQDFLS